MSTAAREQQLVELLRRKAYTVQEIAVAMGCSDGLVRYYLKRLGEAAVRKALAKPGRRSVLVFSWAEDVPATSEAP